MDWVKVAKALDDEWWSRSQVAKNRPEQADANQQALLAQIAFMLRDCLIAGMSPDDREKLAERETR